MEIRYVSLKERSNGHTITIDYLVQIDENKKIIRWVEYPRIPEGMHPREGDAYGWGGRYYKKDQSFEEFLKSPHQKLPKDVHKTVLKHIKKINKTS
ncbi:MAG: hypothetical protein GY810_29045 [Aureispira sp.]|nr:hypothetical protein [Aureispira sp.]